MTINVVPYDQAWPTRFETARRTLEAQLAPWLSAGVEHIVSTAVPRLSAKPIIDMIVGVHDLAAARAAIPLLEATGWRHADHRPDEALWFHRPGGSDWAARTHHLHLTEVTSRLWAERLCFRDTLRADPELLREYEQLKHQAAMETSDMAEYTRHKKTPDRLRPPPGRPRRQVARTARLRSGHLLRLPLRGTAHWTGPAAAHQH